MMPIGFFFNYNNEIIQLPVNPDKIQVTGKGNNKTVEVIQLGEISILKDKKLQSIAFKSFFPEQDWFPAIQTRGNFKGPDFYVNFIEKIRIDKKPCQFIVTGIGITMKVSIESFDYYHQGGDHEDKYYEIELKEWRDSLIIEIPFDETLKRTTTTTPTTASLTPSTPTSTVTSTSSSSSTTTSSGTKASSPAPAKPLTPSQITINTPVILTGSVYVDPYGKQLVGRYNGFRCRVDSMYRKKGVLYPYHVKLENKGPLGYVALESLVIA
jgi:hypothetical protein